jgi:hypothetical protein
VRLGFIYWERTRPVSEIKRPQETRGIPDELDTLELKILSFYTTDQPVRGEPFVVCYGVLNATEVRLEPPLAEVGPSLNRCVNVTLRQETQLTLRVFGKNGEESAASFRIGVKEPRPEFLFVSISGREFKRGEKWTVCYGVKKATKVWLEPGPRMLGVSDKACAMMFPSEAPKKIVAESPGGREEVTLPVKMKM